MPKIFSQQISVEKHHTDINRHVNNVQYVQWMQDVAIAHSTAQGWDMEAYVRIGGGWVVRAHHIEYLAPLFVGDTVEIRTWVASMGSSSSERRYTFIHAETGKIAARASTQWVFIDMKSGKVRPVDDQVREHFEIAGPDGDL